MAGTPLPKGKTSQYEANRPGKKLNKSSYPNVVAERNEMLISGAASNNLSTSQQQELIETGISVSPDVKGSGVVVTQTSPPKYGETTTTAQGVKITPQQNPTYTKTIEERNKAIIERNKELAQEESTNTENAVEKYNRENQDQELKKALIEGRVSANTQGQYLITPRKEETTGGYTNPKPELFTAPRTTSTQETMSKEADWNPDWELKQKLYPNVLRGEDAKLDVIYKKGEYDIFGRPVLIRDAPTYLERKSEEAEFRFKNTKDFSGSGMSGELKQDIIYNPKVVILGTAGAVAANFFVGAAVKPAISFFKMGYTGGKEGFAAETYYSIRHPIITARSMVTSAIINPAEFAGSLVTYKYVFEGMTTLAKVKVRTLEIPQEGGTTPVKLLGFETKGGRALTVGSYNEGRIGLGTPDLIETFRKMPEGKEIKIGSALETKAIKKITSKYSEEFVSPERAESYIDLSQTIIRKTRNVNNKFSQDSFPLVTERLPPEGVQVVLNIAKEKKGVISGSFSRSRELAPTYEIGGETYSLSKVPRDIDVHLDTLTPEEIGGVAQETLGQLQSKGIKARLRSEGGTVKNAIEVQQPSGTWEKAVEFLGEGTIPEGEAVPEFVLGFEKSGEKIDVKGIKSTSLNEELRGVIQGTARFKKTEQGFDIYPPEKRTKDIGSEVVSSRTLLQSKVFKSKLGKAQTKWESLYSKELVLDQLTKTNPEQRIILVDFSGSKQTISKSSTNIIISPERSDRSIISSTRINPVSSFSLNPSKSNSEYSISGSQTLSPSKSTSPSPSKITSYSYNPSPSQTKSPSTSPSKFTSPSISSYPSKSISNYGSPSPTPSKIKSISASPSESTNRFNPTIPSAKIEFISQEGKKPSFNVEVRRRGKFEVVASNVPLAKAFNIGKSQIGGSAAASYRVVPTTGQGASELAKGFGGGLGRGLYASKREPGVIIERPSYRIKSSGEISEITMKGIAANRKKKRIGLI